MVEVTAHCSLCGSDEGVISIHFDTSWNATFIKFTCGHTIRIRFVREFLTKTQLDELFPEELKKKIIRYCKECGANTMHEGDTCLRSMKHRPIKRFKFPQSCEPEELDKMHFDKKVKDE